MRLSQRLWEDSKEVVESCLRHPFVRGIADGTLERQTYSRFIAQDAFFLDVFARAYAAGVYRAPDPESRRDWYELQSGVFDELRVHAAAAEELGIDLTDVTPLAATRAYTDFLLGSAFGGALGELVASMAPCMRLYWFLGDTLAKEERPSHDYTEWIETYSAPEFADLVGRLEALLDRYGDGNARERDCYSRAMRLEYEFFEGAWQG